MLGLLSMVLFAAASPLALQIPDKKIEITVGDHAVWYHNPVWVAIGILAVVVVLLIVVLIARGGGTTVIKD
jgi:hypothetical protein